MSTIEDRFEDPPESESEWRQHVADTLRLNPGRWAVVSYDAPSSLASRINKGLAAGFGSPGSFEAKARTISTEPRRFKVWARFHPPAEGSVT